MVRRKGWAGLNGEAPGAWDACTNSAVIFSSGRWCQTWERVLLRGGGRVRTDTVPLLRRAPLPAWPRARITSSPVSHVHLVEGRLGQQGLHEGPGHGSIICVVQCFCRGEGGGVRAAPRALGECPLSSPGGPTADLHHDPAVTPYPFLPQARHSSDFSLGITPPAAF